MEKLNNNELMFSLAAHASGLITEKRRLKHYYPNPGDLIKAQSEETRTQLRTLTADELNNIRPDLIKMILYKDEYELLFNRIAGAK